MQKLCESIKKVFALWNTRRKRAPESLENKQEDKSRRNNVDVNKPVENPKLKKLLNQLGKNNTLEHFNNIIEEIVMNAHFLSVVIFSQEPQPCSNGKVLIKENSTIQLPIISSQDGQKYYPVFTDWYELGKWHDLISPKTLILSFDDYTSMVEQDKNISGLIINPFSDKFLLNRQEISRLKKIKEYTKNGIYERKITEDTEVLLGDPKEYPTEIVNAISEFLRSGNAKRAWLRLMKRDQETLYLVVVDFSDDMAKVFGGIANSARPYLNGMKIEMVKYADGFGISAVENVTPFYQNC